MSAFDANWLHGDLRDVREMGTWLVTVTANAAKPEALAAKLVTTFAITREMFHVPYC